MRAWGGLVRSAMRSSASLTSWALAGRFVASSSTIRSMSVSRSCSFSDNCSGLKLKGASEGSLPESRKCSSAPRL